MTAEKPDKFDYAPIVIEVLREAGGLISGDELYERVMRHPEVPSDERDIYWAPLPGFERSSRAATDLGIMLDIETRMADERDRGDEPTFAKTLDGYWLLELGPLPLAEEQRKSEYADELARWRDQEARRAWPAYDPYPKPSLASESELREVAEQLVAHRSMLTGQRMVSAGPPSLAKKLAKEFEEEGLLDEARRRGEERARRIGVLMAWYGDAVRRTDGADPQDLFMLAGLDFIRDPERTPAPTRQPQPTETPAPARQTHSMGTPKAKQSSGGCYVATSVYGHYDAPEVRVLRRWRDDVLSRSRPGRIFIRFYYAASPGLVRSVGDRRWFSAPSRWALDRLVRRLDS